MCWLSQLLSKVTVTSYSFYPRGASDVRVLAIIVSVCVSVCVSHAGIVSKNQKGALVFWRQKLLVDDPLPMKFALKVTHPLFKHHNFDKYPLIAP